MTTANEIRAAYLEFFASEGHEIVASSPLVPRNDPTLMFTNAGMVQFKNVFTGAETLKYTRAVSSQKCVRAGGKHNDLDNVGYTARHHTFFEMLGNFSFGDYFKAEAIEFAWRLITREFGIAAERLVVTVFTEDDEAHGLWRKIAGLGDDQLLRIATSDNFWAMGATGPCGPCSEIFFDHGPELKGGLPGSKDQDGDRYVEIWNLVFMQYEQVSGDKRVDLPKPSIDTGMGLERLAAVLQGTHDNYKTDLFQGLIAASAEASGVAPEGGHATSHRVIADHLRAVGFLIADGVLPSNEGRGYVLRRIMRRAMRHATTLGCREPLMWKLVPALVAQMGQAYPELVRAQALVTETLKHEEQRFRRTLDRGLSLLEEAVAELDEGTPLAGEVAFKLYDTYGFPFDLTQDALRARGLSVDGAGFEAAMSKQRQEARKAWAGSGEAATEEVWFDLREACGASDFLGYETEHAEGEVVGLVVDGGRVGEAAAGAEVAVVVNQTPFYGESGGQAGDSGVITAAGGARVAVRDTHKKLGDLHIHLGRVEDGTLKVGEAVRMAVDGEQRACLRANHSATHLLHEALRRALGEHVTQKGSLVASDRLRFDVSHPKALTAEELAAVEADVNLQIRGNQAVQTRLMTPDEAIEAGALALFGEKYGEEVRVVAMGRNTGNGETPYSTELCGGTHVRRAGDIALFKIVSEGAVAAGVRRIEALTGEAARAHFVELEQGVVRTAATLKIAPAEVPARVEALLKERRQLEKALTEARRALAQGGGDAPDGDAEVREVGGVSLICRRLDGVPPKELPPMIDDGKVRVGSGVVAFVTVNEGKVALAVGVTGDLTDRISAVELVRAGAAAVGGKGGGGRPDMAQAGGPDGAAADKAVAAIEAALASA